VGHGEAADNHAALPMTGRSKSHRRLTVGWLHPKIAPAKACVTLRRISMTTIATESTGPQTKSFLLFTGLL
jgi:hypothetical protein